MLFSVVLSCFQLKPSIASRARMAIYSSVPGLSKHGIQAFPPFLLPSSEVRPARCVQLFRRVRDGSIPSAWILLFIVVLSCFQLKPSIASRSRMAIYNSVPRFFKHGIQSFPPFLLFSSGVRPARCSKLFRRVRDGFFLISRQGYSVVLCCAKLFPI